MKKAPYNLALCALCALLACGSAAAAAGRGGRMLQQTATAPAVAATAAAPAPLLSVPFGQLFGQLVGAYTTAIDRLRPRIIAAPPSAPRAPVVTMLGGRADASAANSKTSQPGKGDGADGGGGGGGGGEGVKYTYAPELEVSPKWGIAPLNLEPTLTLAVAPSFSNALAASLGASFTPEAEVSGAGPLSEALEAVFTPPATTVTAEEGGARK